MVLSLISTLREVALYVALYVALFPLSGLDFYKKTDEAELMRQK